MFSTGCHLGCHLDFHLNTDLTSSVNAPLNYEPESCWGGTCGLSQTMNDFDSPCADTRQTDRNVQDVRELVDGQSCHVGKCLLLPSTPHQQMLQTPHGSLESEDFEVSWAVDTNNHCWFVFQALVPSCLFLWCCSRQGSSSSSTAETFGAP